MNCSSAPHPGSDSSAGDVVRPEPDTALESLRSRAEQLSVNTAGAGLVPAGSSAADAQKLQLARQRASALKMREEAKAIEAQIRADMEAKLAELRSITAPLLEQVKKLEEGIWTLNLYLGRDEEILTLATGAPADPDTPLTLRQEVLSMDEETAAHAEDGGIDARHLDIFDQWIIRPENLARVLPEEKGVVVLVPRSRGREYADPWVDQQLNEANRWSYFLLRNGENIYRMRTDFVVGKRLIPATDEFTGLFLARRYDPTTRTEQTYEVEPGTREWDEATKRQDARQRHFMRMALILQGLVDRTPVFHPLPAGGLNLLSEKTYAQGRAHLVLDAEHVLTDGREDFYTWLGNLNRNLRVGMRILGAFNTAAFTDAGGEYHESSNRGPGYYHPNDRITPAARNRYDADRPESNVIYRLDGRRTVAGVQGFTFKFDRKERWMGRGYDAEVRAPKTRGTCVILTEDKFVLPFDLVSVDDMAYYLASRRNRSAYEHMFPLLKAAIAAKEAELEAEAPFRTLLAGALVNAGADLTTDQAQRAVAELVDWWKLGNKWHRPLVTTDDPATEAKAIKAIVAEYLARTKGAATQAGQDDQEAAVVARLLAADPTIMVIGRKRDGGYLAFAPQPRSYSPHVVRHDVWAREYTTTATARTIKSRDWVIPGTRMDKTRVLHTAEAWEGWAVHTAATADLTDPEIDAVVVELVPRVLELAQAGWPARFRNSAPEPGETLLVQGVVLDQSKSKFQVWVTRPGDPPELDQEPSAAAGNTVKEAYGAVDVRYTKSQRDGVVVVPAVEDDALNWPLRWHDKPRYSSATPARPWEYVWDGRVRDFATVVEFAHVQDLVTARAERIAAHNQVIAERREQARRPIWQIKAAWEARAEAQAYARFLEDYADPDLWEGHRKTLRGLEASIHPYGRDVPAVLDTALRTLVDDGIDVAREFTGRTVADIVTTAGLDTGELPEDLVDLVLVEPDPTLH